MGLLAKWNFVVIYTLHEHSFVQQIKELNPGKE